MNPILDYPPEQVEITCKDCYVKQPEGNYYKRTERHHVKGKWYVYTVTVKRCKKCFMLRMKNGKKRGKQSCNDSNTTN